MKTTRPDLIEAAKKVGATVSVAHADAVDKEARFPRESFAALKEAKLLSAYIPKSLGGEGCTLGDISAICHALGHHCSSTAMVFAMHQIQVACLVHHGQEQAWQRTFMQELSAKQLLLASATSEAGVGGNVRQSSCAVERDAVGKFKLVKNATVISYGKEADAILVTARSGPEAPSGDQVLAVVKKQDYSLEQTGTWDTLGMRGTASYGHLLTANCHVDQILGTPYADISARTMLPWAHITWASLWLGIASESVNRARAFVRAEARKTPGTTPPGALRTAETMSDLQLMRANLVDTTEAYMALMNQPDQLTALSFAVRMNHLKVASSGDVGEDHSAGAARGRHSRLPQTTRSSLWAVCCATRCLLRSWSRTIASSGTPLPCCWLPKRRSPCDRAQCFS